MEIIIKWSDQGPQQIIKNECPDTDKCYLCGKEDDLKDLQAKMKGSGLW